MKGSVSYRKCELYENKLCSCKEGCCTDIEVGCVYMHNFKEENGYLVDYTSKWLGTLCGTVHARKRGWRVFDKEGSFVGLLDEGRVAIWYVDVRTLERCVLKL